MKKHNLLTFLFISLVYFCVVFKIHFKHVFSLISILYSFLFSLFFYLIIKIFKPKLEKIISFTILFLIYILYGIQVCVKALFGFYFDFDLLGIAGQVGAFWKESFYLIFNNLLILVLLALPLIIYFILLKHLNFEPFKNKFFSYIFVTIMFSLYLFTPRIEKESEVIISNYDVLTSFTNDFKHKKEVELQIENEVIEEVNETPEEEIEEIKYHSYNIDFENLESSSSTINKLNNYFGSLNETSYNDLTGYFEDKNLILILGESFNEIGIKEDLTPTLYKMKNDGFNFSNYYSTSYNSTVGGEFQLLNSMYAKSSVLAKWKEGVNDFPFSAPNLFTKKGYSTYAYHNNTYNYMERNQYLNAYGFDNYTACWNGLEKKMNCHGFPESDEEMFNATVNDYINDDKFFAYYVTVSGHGPYTLDQNRNTLDVKYYDYVKSLGYNYSEKIMCYLSSMVVLDKALTSLLDQLIKANKLDDTVIVLVGDHYPYYLDSNDYKEYLGRVYEEPIEVCKNSLIIYNTDKEAKTSIKTGQTMDVMPTLYNLFNIDYDSRLIVGSDLFASDIGFAYFGNGSFVSDEGIYYAGNNKFISDKEISEERKNYLVNYANTKMSLTSLIFDSNYYHYIKDYTNKR